MGESQQKYPLEFEPQCPQFRWMQACLGGWQFGEQRLIATIVRILGGDSLCVEVGAGDGHELPVTIHDIYEARPSDCILVEIDDARKRQLSLMYSAGRILSCIDWSNLYRECQSPDLIVIDIDGKDSVIMRNMLNAGVRPRMLVCEHLDRMYSISATSPDPLPEWILGAKTETGHTIQDTAETLHWIASKYGYERIGWNRCNSFFVRRDLFPLMFMG